MTTPAGVLLGGLLILTAAVVDFLIRRHRGGYTF